MPVQPVLIMWIAPPDLVLAAKSEKSCHGDTEVTEKDMKKQVVLPPPCAPCLRGNELLFPVALTDPLLDIFDLVRESYPV